MEKKYNQIKSGDERQRAQFKGLSCFNRFYFFHQVSSLCILISWSANQNAKVSLLNPPKKEDTAPPKRRSTWKRINPLRRWQKSWKLADGCRFFLQRCSFGFLGPSINVSEDCGLWLCKMLQQSDGLEIWLLVVTFWGRCHTNLDRNIKRSDETRFISTSDCWMEPWLTCGWATCFLLYQVTVSLKAS